MLALPGAAPLRYGPNQPPSKSYVLVPETTLSERIALAPGELEPQSNIRKRGERLAIRISHDPAEHGPKRYVQIRRDGFGQHRLQQRGIVRHTGSLGAYSTASWARLC